MFEAVYLGRTRADLQPLTDEDRREADRLIAEIEHNPLEDGRRKGRFDLPPLVLNAYTNEIWRIVYRLVDDRFAEIYGVR